MDELGWLAGRRRRIFYDEVLLVTYHRQRGWLAAAVLFTLGAVILVAAVLLGVAGWKWTALAVGLAGALPFLAAGVLRLALKLSIVTAYGKRSQARLEFWLRQERARQVFQRICTRAREAQQEVAPHP